MPLNDGYPGMEKRMLPLMKEIVLARKEYLEKHVIQQQSGSNSKKATAAFEEVINAAQTASLQKSTFVADAAPHNNYEDRIRALENDLKAANKLLE